MYSLQVTKSSDTEGLNQQRLLLDVNHKGVTLTVNQGMLVGVNRIHTRSFEWYDCIAGVSIFWQKPLQ